MIDNSLSVVKRDLEPSHTEEETQFKNSPPTDNLKLNPSAFILDSAPVPVEESPVQPTVVEPFKKQNIPQEKDNLGINSFPVIFMKEMFNLINIILMSPQGMMWGFLMFLMCQVALSRAATVPQRSGPLQALPPGIDSLGRDEISKQPKHFTVVD